MSIFTAENKRMSLAEAASIVQDGMIIAVGGGLSWREPMALLRELVQQGRRNLHVVGSAHGVDIDLLCGADAISVVEESYVGFEHDFGMAPNFRRACESGIAQVRDTCCHTLIQQLRAAEYGVPFLPVRSVQGTDFLQLHPEYKTMTCPFTGLPLVLVPALSPDVAIVHAQYGDAQGNLKILPPLVADLLFIRASKHIIATVEQMVPADELRAMEPNVPYFWVESVVEVPYGAHPTSCYPFYAYDRAHLAEYYSAAQAGQDAFVRDYLTHYVFEPTTHNDYLNRIGGEAKLRTLESWNEGDEAWRRLFTAPEGAIA
ncbi:MAG: CoA transferase subunit A [Chloroflexota bacterium]|nr:CoA transferase subunit A [Chloroflexota bacterium]